MTIKCRIIFPQRRRKVCIIYSTELIHSLLSHVQIIIIFSLFIMSTLLSKRVINQRIIRIIINVNKRHHAYCLLSLSWVCSNASMCLWHLFCHSHLMYQCPFLILFRIRGRQELRYEVTIPLLKFKFEQ